MREGLGAGHLVLSLAVGVVGNGAEVCRGQSSPPPATVIYATGFEVEEGYSYADEFLPLRGQMGWIGEGSGGNGLLTNFFEGFGQQAYVGFAPPAPKDELLNIWRPAIYRPPGQLNRS